MEMLESDVVKKAYRSRISSLRNSVSTFNVEIVLKPGTFPYLNFNRYHFKTDDIWNVINVKGERWPQTYFIFCPKSSASDVYASNITIMTYMDFEEVRKWENTFATIPKSRDSRGEEYEAFKLERAQRLLQEAYKKYPQLKDSIQSFSTSTPLTYRDYIGVSDGGLYGIAKDYHDPLKTFISPKTKIPNLLFTGQNLNMHGVLGVTIGAIRTCGELIGQNYLLKKINGA
jgi:all-trans-retinol 13,14-reductase